MMKIKITVKIESEANCREHWRKKAARVKYHRKLASVLTASAMIDSEKLTSPIVIKFVRVGKRRLDDDNLASGFKAVRDGVCDALGIDDGSEDLRFHYAQAIGDYSAIVCIS